MTPSSVNISSTHVVYARCTAMNLLLPHPTENAHNVTTCRRSLPSIFHDRNIARSYRRHKNLLTSGFIDQLRLSSTQTRLRLSVTSVLSVPPDIIVESIALLHSNNQLAFIANEYRFSFIRLKALVKYTQKLEVFRQTCAFANLLNVLRIVSYESYIN